ncbi:MAG: tetratricopeptide repeat protein [Candidatus Anammoxibacter sp.]
MDISKKFFAVGVLLFVLFTNTAIKAQEHGTSQQSDTELLTKRSPEKDKDYKDGEDDATVEQTRKTPDIDKEGIHAEVGRDYSAEELLAMENDPEIQYQLGLDYKQGKHGSAKNYYVAAEWFKKSAERGHVDAQYELGYMYWEGEGVFEDLIEAYAWLLLSSKNGNVKAKDLRHRLQTIISTDERRHALSRAQAFEPK